MNYRIHSCRLYWRIGITYARCVGNIKKSLFLSSLAVAPLMGDFCNLGEAILLDGWKFFKSFVEILEVLEFIQASFFQYQMDVSGFHKKIKSGSVIWSPINQVLLPGIRTAPSGMLGVDQT